MGRDTSAATDKSASERRRRKDERLAAEAEHDPAAFAPDQRVRLKGGDGTVYVVAASTAHAVRAESEREIVLFGSSRFEPVPSEP